MAEPVNELPKRLSDDLDRRLDEFDAAWHNGTPPDLQEFIPRSFRTNEAPRPQWRRYVAELLTVDLEYRLRRPDPDSSPRIEDYYETIPWLAGDESVLMELIPAEYMARHQHADGPAVAEYKQRFPHLKSNVATRLVSADTELVRERPSSHPGNDEPIAESFIADEKTVTDPTLGNTDIESATSIPPAPKGLTRSFGDYEILREIARGGMGIVYKAIQKSLKRTVALKVILAGGFAQEEDVRRFHSEAEAAARLDHPNIVPIYEVGQHQGSHFFSMAYVSGPSLSAEVANQPLDPARAALVIRDVADAMHYAHQHEVIHRDIKPSNVLLEGGRKPRITDFGLARQTNVEDGVTVTGQVIGTPSYMPPEQALGHTHRVDARSDVYSMGATLYCLLTGRAPFQAATIVQTMTQVVQQDPVPPRRLNDHIPRDLENICLKCLNKSPDARYASAADLLDDLNRFLSGQPTIARPLSSAERLVRFWRRKPGISAMIGVSLLLLAALTAVSWKALLQTRQALDESIRYALAIKEREREARAAQEDAEHERTVALRQTEIAEESRRRADAQAQLATDAEHRERAARVRAEDALRVAEFNIYLNTLQRTQQLWSEGDVDGARDLLVGLRSNLKLWDDLHGWEWDHVYGLLRQEQLVVPAHDKPILSACWNHDGSYFASASQDRSIRVWTRDESEKAKLHATLRGHTDWVRTIRFVGESPQLVSLSHDGSVRLWDTTKGGLIRIAADDLRNLQATAISPDGRRWAWCDSSGQVTVGELSSNEPINQWQNPDTSVSALAFDASGERLAVANRSRQSITIRRVAGVDPGVTLSNDDAAPFAMAFSADGERLAAGGGSDWAQVWETQTGKRVARWNAHRGSIYDVRFGGDSDQLLTCSEDQTVRLWSVSRESTLDVFRGHTGPVFSVDVHQSGGGGVLSAGADGTLRLWRPGRDQISLPDDIADHSIFPIAEGNGLQYLSDGMLCRYGFDDSIVDAEVSLPFDDAATNFLPLGGRDDPFVVCRGNRLLTCDVQGAQISEFAAVGSEIQWLCADRNAARLAVADVDGVLRIIDLTNTETLWQREFASRIAAMCFASGDGQVIVLDIDGSAGMFDAATGDPLMQSTLADGARAMHLCPAFPTLAVGSLDGAIRLYNTADLSEDSVLRGHLGSVSDVAFSPNGRRLASAGSDRTVRIWAPEVRSWERDQEALLITLNGHQRPVMHVFWTADGQSLISVDRGGTAIRWRTRDKR